MTTDKLRHLTNVVAVVQTHGSALGNTQTIRANALDLERELYGSIAMIASTQFVHGFYECRDVIRVDIRRDAVAQIKNVAATCAVRIQNTADFSPDSFARPIKGGRV